MEALQNDLGAVALDTVLFPFAGLQPSFEVEGGALLDVLLDDGRDGIVQNDNPVSFGEFFAFATRLVSPALGRGEAEIGNRAPVGRSANIGVLADVSDEADLVQRGHVNSCVCGSGLWLRD